MAIRASSAIPSVLMPVSKDGALLVDGGVVNPLPLEHVDLPEGNLLVAVNVNAPRIEKTDTEKKEKATTTKKLKKKEKKRSQNFLRHFSHGNTKTQTHTHPPSL